MSEVGGIRNWTLASAPGIGALFRRAWSVSCA